MMYKWDAKQALELIQAEKITGLNSVPAVIQDLLKHPQFDDYDTRSLIRIGAAGAADAFRRMLDRLPQDVQARERLAGVLAESGAFVEAVAECRAVVERRFGLHGYRRSTLEQIGEEIGVTRERVRQIQLDALKNLRAMMESQGISGDVILD